MPPRKAVDPAEKQKQFDQWKETDEYKSILKWQETRAKEPEVDKMDNAYIDITADWQPILDDLFAMVEKFKVPGRKAKCKFQIDQYRNDRLTDCIFSVRTTNLQNYVLAQG